MPRQSAASARVPVFELPPPDPPEHLSQEAQDVWRSFRSNWFEGCECILEIYCNLVLQSRQVVGMLAECEKGSPRWIKLAKLYVTTVGSMVRAATSMRMTVQSSRDARHVKHATARGPRPWDEPEPNEPKRKPS